MLGPRIAREFEAEVACLDFPGHGASAHRPHSLGVGYSFLDYAASAIAFIDALGWGDEDVHLVRDRPLSVWRLALVPCCGCATWHALSPGTARSSLRVQNERFHAAVMVACARSHVRTFAVRLQVGHSMGAATASLVAGALQLSRPKTPMSSCTEHTAAHAGAAMRQAPGGGTEPRLETTELSGAPALRPPRVH